MEFIVHALTVFAFGLPLRVDLQSGIVGYGDITFVRTCFGWQKLRARTYRTLNLFPLSVKRKRRLRAIPFNLGNSQAHVPGVRIIRALLNPTATLSVPFLFDFISISIVFVGGKL